MLVGLIVHDVEFGLEFFGGEFVEMLFICLKHHLVIQACNRSGQYAIGLIMVQEKC